MEDVVLGLIFSIGLFLVAIWFGYRGAIIRRIYNSVSETTVTDTSGFATGQEATIEGDVVIDRAANESYHGETIVESVPAALLLWRIRERKTRSGGWSVVESGLESGEFKIDTGSDHIQVDSEWLGEQHSNEGLETLNVSNFKSRGLVNSLEAKTGVLSPYVYLDKYSDSVDIMETDFFSTDVYDHTGNSRQKYQLEVEMAPQTKPLTVHGQINIDHGEVVISGSDSVPMVVSTTGIESLKKNLRSQMITSGAYAVGSGIASFGFFYVWVLPEVQI